MKLSKIFFIPIIIVGLCSKYYAQDSIPSYNLQDNHLRARIVFSDTVAIQCKCNVENDSLYKFEIGEIIVGSYTNKFIYVCTDNVSFYKFTSKKELNREYWWTLCKTEEMYGIFPIYHHCGNF